MLQRVDDVPITCNQKLLLYRAAVCPRLSWDFTINKFPISCVTTTLEAMATRFLKKWVGLARPADQSRLYLPTSEGGLGLPAISTCYRKQQASVASLLLTSPDPIVQHTIKLATRKEESLSRPSHQPMTEVREIWQADPGASRRSLLKRAKANASAKDTDRRMEHARNLPHQGQLLQATESSAASTWSATVLQLPPQVLRFSLNAAQDTLPHNFNLAMWKKRKKLSDACKLCGQTQTLAHVLNQCPVALHLHWYNIRHDAVLQVIKEGIQPLLHKDDNIMADIHDYQSPHQPYNFPPQIAHTDLCPDIVIWNPEMK